MVATPQSVAPTFAKMGALVRYPYASRDWERWHHFGSSPQA